MVFSQAIMFFIIITTAVTLHANGITNIATASQAAEALRPVAGDFAYLLFTVGIIGTGLLAVPILAGSSAYAVSETLGLKEGLSKKPDWLRASTELSRLPRLLVWRSAGWGLTPLRRCIMRQL